MAAVKMVWDTRVQMRRLEVVLGLPLRFRAAVLVLVAGEWSACRRRKGPKPAGRSSRRRRQRFVSCAEQRRRRGCVFSRATRVSWTVRRSRYSWTRAGSLSQQNVQLPKLSTWRFLAAGVGKTMPSLRTAKGVPMATQARQVMLQWRDLGQHHLVLAVELWAPAVALD